MNAKEARYESEIANVEASHSQIVEIMSKIAIATKHGNYNIYIYTAIKAEVKHKLESDGYKVTDLDSNDGLTIKISW